MGMDYSPRNPRTESAQQGFHLNWTSHLMMAELLDQLGADMRRWSGTNDGDYIPKRTCQTWAALLRDGIRAERIQIMKAPDPIYSSGYHRRFVVKDPSSTEFAGMFDFLDQYFATANAAGDPADSPTAVASAPPELLPLDDQTAGWIERFAAFLDECGGCKQC